MRSPTRLTWLVAALAVLVLTASTTQAARSSRAAAPACTGSQLKGKLLDSNGAAGTILFSVTLRNSGTACSLVGFPSLRIKGAKGLLPTHVVHGGLAVLNQAPKLVQLAHLGHASVLISFSDVPVGSETSCPAGTALRLRPPGASDWLMVKAETEACGHGTLHESPVLAGVHSSR